MGNIRKKFQLHLSGILSGIFLITSPLLMADNEPQKPYWQDTQVVSVNKEPPRTSFMTYDNRSDALSGKF